VADTPKRSVGVLPEAREARGGGHRLLFDARFHPFMPIRYTLVSLAFVLLLIRRNRRILTLCLRFTLAHQAQKEDRMQ
jgi:hypothetical protein